MGNAICIPWHNIMVWVVFVMAHSITRSWHTRSLSPKMLTCGNFKETYGKLNYEILLYNIASNTTSTAQDIYFFFCVAVSIMVHYKLLVQKTHACSAQIRNIITRSSIYWPDFLQVTGVICPKSGHFREKDKSLQLIVEISETKCYD